MDSEQIAKDVDYLRADKLTPEVSEAIEADFPYVPWGPQQIEQGRSVRAILVQCVKVLIVNVPPCHDRTLAIQWIKNARLDANSAIVNGGKQLSFGPPW